MRKRSLTNILILGLLVLGPLAGIAQQNGNAQSILRNVNTAYAKYSALEVAFDFNYKRNQNSQNHKESGTMVLDQKQDRYRIKMPSQEYISDGKTQWLVLVNEKEVQVTDVAEHAGAITPSNLFSFFQKGYSAKVMPDEKSGNHTLTTLELTPENPRQPYSRIKLRINKTSNLVSDVTIVDKNGAQFNYTIKSLKPNPNLQERIFIFDKQAFPEMEVVDLR